MATKISNKAVIEHLWGEFTGVKMDAWIQGIADGEFISEEELADSESQTKFMASTEKVNEYYFTLSCFLLLSLNQQF